VLGIITLRPAHMKNHGPPGQYWPRKIAPSQDNRTPRWAYLGYGYTNESFSVKAISGNI
jgi:hypothetical protein